MWRIKLNDESAFRTFSSLLPYLNGQLHVEAIFGKLEEQGIGRESARKLLEHLEKSSLIEEGHSNGLLPEEEEFLSRDLDFGVELLSDLIRSPAFPDSSVERLKRRHLDLLRQQAYQPAEVADLWFARAVYGDHVYGRALLGSSSSLNAIERGNLVDFYRNHFTSRDEAHSGAGRVRGEKRVSRPSG